MPSNPRNLHRKLFPTSHRLLLERSLKDRLAGLRGEVLVIGAGYDPYRDWLKSAKSVYLTDVDRSLEGLDSVADAHDLPFDDQSFDAIVAVEVFEHLRMPNVAAAEMHRVMRAGGRSIISIPFMFHVHGDPYDYQRLTRSGLEELFCMFRGCQISAFGGRRHSISDIVTTATRPFAALRVLNHLLCAPMIRGNSSWDCPSGYVVELEK